MKSSSSSSSSSSSPSPFPSPSSPSSLSSFIHLHHHHHHHHHDDDLFCCKMAGFASTDPSKQLSLSLPSVEFFLLGFPQSITGSVGRLGNFGHLFFFLPPNLKLHLFPPSRDSVVIFQGVILVIFALTRIWPSNIRPFPSLAKFCKWTWYGTASLIGKCLGRADGQSCKFARQQRTL